MVFPRTALKQTYIKISCIRLSKGNHIVCVCLSFHYTGSWYGDLLPLVSARLNTYISHNYSVLWAQWHQALGDYGLPELEHFHQHQIRLKCLNVICYPIDP